jgi:uncharacterized protein YuzE
MKIKYDAEVDIMRIIFNEDIIAESDEEKSGIIMDYDINGNVVGIEILDASKKIPDTNSVEYEKAGV